MKYLKLFWKCLYWSCIWYVALCFLVIFVVPDHLTGMVLAIFIAPFFGVTTALLNFMKQRKSQLA